MKAIRQLVWIAIALLCASTGFAQNKTALQKKRSKLLQEIKLTNKLIVKNENSQALTSAEIATLNKQIRLRQSLVNTIDKEVKEVKNKISENKAVIESLESSLESLKKEYSQLIFLSYRNRNSQDQLMYIFASDDFYQAVRRVQFLNDMREYRQEQGALILSTKESIDKKNAALVDQQKEKEGLLADAIQAKRSIDKDKKRLEKALALINQDQDKLKAQLEDKKKKRRNLQKAIEKIIAAEIAKAKSTSTGTTKGFELTPEEKIQSAYFSKNKGKLPWPVEKGVVIGTFGVSKHATMSSIEVVNNGVDIATSKNSTVRAIFGGEVSGIINIPGSGMAVVVKHGEYRAVYSNLHEVFVIKGQQIETKEDVGILKSDENQSIAHLEIWKITSKGMEKEDPEDWIAN